MLYCVYEEGAGKMPTISMFRGIKVCIYWKDHMPPHIHAFYGGDEIIVSIEELDVFRRKQELFEIAPLR